MKLECDSPDHSVSGVRAAENLHFRGCVSCIMLTLSQPNTQIGVLLREHLWFGSVGLFA